jgi:hypothetical protein
MIENIDTVPIFISDKGVPYRLFIHSCPQKEKIAELIEVSERSFQFKFRVFFYNFEWINMRTYVYNLSSVVYVRYIYIYMYMFFFMFDVSFYL